MADDTRINQGVTGDMISTEELPIGTPRQGQGQTTTTTRVMIPRSKIAVGRYGVDEGDASENAPLDVTSAQERRLDGGRGGGELVQEDHPTLLGSLGGEAGRNEVD